MTILDAQRTVAMMVYVLAQRTIMGTVIGFSSLQISWVMNAVIIAEAIYQAATDGTDQMRYIAGPDAEQLIVARKQMDDAAYMAVMKAQMGL